MSMDKSNYYDRPKLTRKQADNNPLIPTLSINNYKLSKEDYDSAIAKLGNLDKLRNNNQWQKRS